MDKLILLKRQALFGLKSPTFEIHRGKIEQTKNLILSTRDEQFANRLVDGYNKIKP